MSTDLGELEKHLAIRANDDRLMATMLSDSIQSDLLLWADGPRGCRISDIRNYDDKLIYAVTGDLNDYVETKLLIDSACKILEMFNDVVSPS